MNVIPLEQKYATQIANVVIGLSGMIGYVDSTYSSLTNALKERFSLVHVSHVTIMKGTNTDLRTYVYAPPLTPMKPIFDTMETLMTCPNALQIVAVVPWQTINNAIGRTNRIMNWGLNQILHLPRNAFKGTSVQICVLDMQRDAHPTHFRVLQ